MQILPIPVTPRPAESDEPESDRRFLLISHHFPPSQATGALRWQKLVGHAAERGWSFDVVTLHPDSLHAPDYSRVATLPQGTRIFGVSRPSAGENAWARAARGTWRALHARRVPTRASAEPGAGVVTVVPEVTMRAEIRWDLHRIGGYLRAARALQSFRKEAEWAREALQVARELAMREDYRGIITCGPPHLAHCAGEAIARQLSLPFVMDLRDPWSLVPGLFAHEASPLWYGLAEHHERRCVQSAALVVTNTEPLQRAMQALYPSAADRIIAVTNGCDEDFRPRSRTTGRFTIAYAGNIYIDRDPRTLFRAAAVLVREEAPSPEEFGIEFIGNAERFGGAAVLALAEAEGLAGYVGVHPRRPRQEALEFLAQASMLLSLPQEVDLAIPSKIFEYMQFEAWLLALARRGSATEMLLRDTPADVVDPDDLDGIVRALRTRYRLFRAGVRPEPVNADGRFDRRHQAARLLDAIEEQVDARSKGRP